uniref:PCI domain-containing protein n=1 Tax=Panagrellus redivivus TaxID=6233 RepID=A0A7E4VW12_PANRE
MASPASVKEPVAVSSRTPVSPSSAVATAKSPSAPNPIVAKNLAALTELLGKPFNVGDDDEKKVREDCILEFGKRLSVEKNTEELRGVILAVRPHLTLLGSAKASKIVRTLVDYCLTIDEDPQVKVDLCKDCIAWAEKTNRVYLSQALSARLIKLLNDIGKYTEASQLISVLSKALRKIDDKEVLLDVQLEESKAMFFLTNLSRARTALASARSTANAVYLSPQKQAALDMQSGILHAADEKDFKTSFSYFFEAFENYDTADDKQEARRALKYMCLTKIILNEADQVKHLLAMKLALKYSGSDLLAMTEVAKAFQTRTLKTFLEAFEKYKKELHDDPVVKAQFLTLSEKMLEKEISRVIEPYKVVEMDHVARRIGLPKERVEKKLAQMLLDKKILGRIDQSQGTLAVFQTQAKAPVCEQVVKVLSALSETVDVSQQRGQTLRHGYVTARKDRAAPRAPHTPVRSKKISGSA